MARLYWSTFLHKQQQPPPPLLPPLPHLYYFTIQILLEELCHHQMSEFVCYAIAAFFAQSSSVATPSSSQKGFFYGGWCMAAPLLLSLNWICHCQSHRNIIDKYWIINWSQVWFHTYTKITSFFYKSKHNTNIFQHCDVWISIPITSWFQHYKIFSFKNISAS